MVAYDLKKYASPCEKFILKFSLVFELLCSNIIGYFELFVINNIIPVPKEFIPDIIDGIWDELLIIMCEVLLLTTHSVIALSVIKEYDVLLNSVLVNVVPNTISVLVTEEVTELSFEVSKYSLFNIDVAENVKNLTSRPGKLFNCI
jgi:hypothetical protein